MILVIRVATSVEKTPYYDILYMVPFLMCRGEDPEDLLQPQVFASSAMVLEGFTTSPRMSATQCARDTG